MEQRLLANEVNEMLIELLQECDYYYPQAGSYFQDLYHTGCRSTEPLSIEQWNMVGNIVSLKTHKTGEIRIINQNLLSDDLLVSIVDKLPAYGALTYDQLTKVFRKYISKHPIYAGDRVADTYLFRYNRARQMFMETTSIEEVMEFFAWQSESNAMKYITQDLVYRNHN